MGVVTEVGGATRKGAEAAPPTGRWRGRSNGSGSGCACSGRGLGLWGGVACPEVFKPEQRDLFVQSAQRLGGCAFCSVCPVSFSFQHAFLRRARVRGRGASQLGSAALGARFYPISSAPCASTEGFLRVPCPGGRPFPYPSRPGARGASLWMRPRSPRREAAGGKRCLQGFTAARDPAPRHLLPRGRSVAAPDRSRRYGREISARADGGEGLAGPVLHAHPAAGQPRWGARRASGGGGPFLPSFRAAGSFRGDAGRGGRPPARRGLFSLLWLLLRCCPAPDPRPARRRLRAVSSSPAVVWGCLR